MLNQIFNEDCLEWMKRIPDWSIDCIITDPPYWTTACKWDTVIPFEPMWEQLKRIIKPNGAIVLFGSEPFSSLLRVSNLKNYKYDWIWEKSRPSNFLQAQYQCLKAHETISVFSIKKHTYYPQKWKIDERFIDRRKKHSANHSSNITGMKKTYRPEDDGSRYPISIIPCISEWGKDMHPTQKPVALIEYLIRTYTNEWETVLDFTIGSGTTAIACINTNRNYIGFELDKWYFDIANERIAWKLQNKE